MDDRGCAGCLAGLGAVVLLVAGFMSIERARAGASLDLPAILGLVGLGFVVVGGILRVDARRND